MESSRMRRGRRPSGATLGKVIVTVAALTGGFGASALLAHDFWIIPNAFTVATGAPLEIRGQTGISFPRSVSAVAPARITDARVIGSAGSEKLGGFTQAGTSLLVTHRPRGAGQQVIAIALAGRITRQSAEGFREYLLLEGAGDLVERYSRSGQLPKDSISMRSTKHAKTVVEIGARGPRAFGALAGHPVEIVPVTDPALVTAGSVAEFRVLFRGTALPAGHVHAGGDRSAPDSAPELSLTTDASGVVRVPVDRNGLWNVRAAHAVPSAPGSGADWDVYWATFVFRAGPQQGSVVLPAPQALNDSAAVAAAVTAYQQALANGDSAAALALLTPDAVILESGGMETLKEYRSHHLPSDIEFSRAVPSVDGPVRVKVRGDVAWAASTNVVKGQFRGRAVNSVGAELMVLNRIAGEWKIVAIHWSSRAVRP